MGLICWMPRCPEHGLACPDKESVRVGQDERAEVVRPCTCATLHFCEKHEH